MLLILSLISVPSISNPNASQPIGFSLANNSIRGRSPISFTIRCRISGGFAECPIILAVHICLTFLEALLGLPLVASKTYSALALVQWPRPKKKVSATLFLLTQTKATVLNRKPQALEVISAWGKHGEVVQRKRAQFSCEMDDTFSFLRSSTLITG